MAQQRLSRPMRSSRVPRLPSNLTINALTSMLAPTSTAVSSFIPSSSTAVASSVPSTAVIFVPPPPIVSVPPPPLVSVPPPPLVSVPPPPTPAPVTTTAVVQPRPIARIRSSSRWPEPMDLDPPGIFVETPYIPPPSQWPEPMELDPPGIYVAVDY
ncbi:15002_t:CDS:1, partial [Funneliformis geosporum]